MILKILIVLAVLLVAFLILVALQPSAFTISRSITIAAPPEVVFAQVNEFKKWEDWSPWAKMDPSMKQTYEGPPAGVGSVSAWQGNSKVGEGRMTIVDSSPPQRVKIRLEFLKPFKATNTAEFTFKPEGAGTSVTWSMSGEKAFVMKAFCLFMSMEKMVGPDFEKGLAQMKAVSETQASAAK